MHNRITAAAWAALCAALTAAPLTAQARPRTAATTAAATQAPARHFQWGPQILYHFEGEAVGVGARFEYSLARLLGTNKVDGSASVNWFPGGVDLFELNYNIVYRFQTPSLSPYAGGGLNFAIASGAGATATDLHLNAVGGLKFKPMGRVTPLVELRYTFAGGDALILSGGVLF